MDTTADIYDELARAGYYKSEEPVSLEQFERTLGELGTWFDPVVIRVGIRHPNLGKTVGLFAHNECNHYAHCLAWYCVEDDGADDRLFISPMAPLERALDEAQLEHLEHAHVTLMRARVPKTTIVRRERGRPILFGPLGLCAFDEDVPGRREAVEAFYRARLELAERHRLSGLSLRTGQFLIIDDRRYMHGRHALPDGCGRVIRRQYLDLHDGEAWLARTVERRPFGTMEA